MNNNKNPITNSELEEIKLLLDSQCKEDISNNDIKHDFSLEENIKGLQIKSTMKK